MSSAARLILAILLVTACDVPDDTLFRREDPAPEEIQPGVFRLTANGGPDYVRGFSEDGARIVYQSRGLAPFPTTWRILSVATEGGAVREEAALYRAAVTERVARIELRGTRRVLAAWRAAAPSSPGCPLPCPAQPAVWRLRIIRLEATDGAPLSSLPSRIVSLPNVLGASSNNVFIRVTPAEGELQAFGADPFGPVILPGESLGVYSDGDALWRFSLTDPSAVPDSIGPGAFPSLSPDGSNLAAAIPTGVTTNTVSCSVVQVFGQCTQQVTTEQAAGWTVVVYDLALKTATTITSGLEPRYAPDGTRLLVRRFDGLHWVDPASGTTSFIPGTSGAVSPVISPDGAIIAFSNRIAGNSDVYFVRP